MDFNHFRFSKYLWDYPWYAVIFFHGWIYCLCTGLAFNSPYPLLLRAQRNLDIILSFDFSRRDNDKAPIFNELLLAEKWARLHQVPFPPIDVDVYDPEGKGYKGRYHALWARITKNPDWSTGPLAYPFTCTAYSFACSILPALLARSTALLPSLVEKWLMRWLFYQFF